MNTGTYAACLEIRPSPLGGVGAFATRAIGAGETFHRLGGRRVSVLQLAASISRHTVAWSDPFPIDDRHYLVLDPVSRALNHSCDPNAGCRGYDEVIALRDIAPGEEVTYDYSMITPRRWYAFRWRMQCRCATPGCRQVVRDIRSLPDSVIERHLAHGAVLNYLVRRA